MIRFVRIKKPDAKPHVSSLFWDDDQYTPLFWHTTIDQDRPVGSRKTFVEHQHDYYHIVLYTKGRGNYSQNGIFYPATPGTCVLTYPGLRHDFVSRWGKAVYSEITFSYVNTSNKYLKIPFDKLLELHAGTEVLLVPQLHFSLDQVQILRNLFLTLTDHLNSTHRFSMFHAHNELTKIFGFLVENAVLARKEQRGNDRFERVKDYIEEHYYKSLTIDELAKLAGFSRGYFFRAFKEMFDIPPLAYQQTIRIEAAKTLLKTTPLRCNEIASRVGFSDVYFFHRIFKKHLGMTPNQFRAKT
ncbi:MAG: helix-turn-helix transcriptional regulator [Sedimentisphaerales bacterium]|nr:helix-turn-helix transcriptional regulator [Sedimentisphaerales bacterium]